MLDGRGPKYNITYYFTDIDALTVPFIIYYINIIHYYSTFRSKGIR